MSVVYIYGLIDPRNDEVFYVGFTKNLNKRYLEHLRTKGRREKNLYKDNVINEILQIDLKPKIKIIDKCDYIFNQKENIFEHERLEIFYIKKYRDEGIKLTNLTIGGDGGCTLQKKVYQYSEDGKFLKEYKSVNEVANAYNVNADIISKAINQRGKKSYRGTYLFSSKEKSNLFEFKTTKKDNIPIIQCSFDGIFIKEYKSQKEASIITNIFQSNINYCLNKKRKHAGGFCWQYKNN
jgi:hypothetical protein